MNVLAVGARGSGKTYSTVKIIKEYEKSNMVSGQGIHIIRTILI